MTKIKIKTKNMSFATLVTAGMISPNPSIAAASPQTKDSTAYTIRHLRSVSATTHYTEMVKGQRLAILAP
jgi:hypothetical protein